MRHGVLRKVLLVRKFVSVGSVVGISLGAISATALTGRANAAPVGMACHLSGRPEVRSGGGAWRPLRMLQKFEAGDAVRCSTGATAVIVLFKSGERFKVGAGKTATVQATTVGGAQSMGALHGPSERVAKTLTGARSGAIMARDVTAPITLTPQAPGWIIDSERVLEWTPGKAVHYTFALFNGDSVVYTGKVTEPRVQLPASLELQQRVPYVWRVVTFDKSNRTGQPVQRGARWGVVTFLSAQDARQLSEDVQQLREQMQQNQEDDTTVAALLAELYREYGVLQKTISLLEDVPLLGSPGSKEATDEAYSQIGLYGLLFGRKEDVSDSFAPAEPASDANP